MTFELQIIIRNLEVIKMFWYFGLFITFKNNKPRLFFLIKIEISL